jgi:hypothetical protein
MSDPQTRTRSIEQIIDQALRENRTGETFLYVCSAILVLVGAVALLYGVWTRQPISTVGGVCSSALFLPAMNFASKIRRQNVAIRLLEAPLMLATTAEEAARAIKDNFIQAHKEEPKVSRAKGGLPDAIGS